MSDNDDKYQKILEEFAQEFISDEINSISENVEKHFQSIDKKDTLNNILIDTVGNLSKAGLKAGLKSLINLIK